MRTFPGPKRINQSRVIEAIWVIEGWGLVLLIFLSFSPLMFHLEEYLFSAFLVLALGVAWFDGKPIWVRSPIDVPLLLLVGWILLTIPFATDTAYSFAEWRKLVAQVLIFYWTLLVLGNQGKNTSRRILTAIGIGTTIICLYALVDFVERGGSLADRYLRASIPYSNAYWLSTYLVITVPLVAALGVAVRPRWQQFICGGVLMLALLAQFLSYIRAGWLALVAQGIAFGLFTARPRLVIWTLVCCLVFGGLLLTLSQVGFQRGTTDPFNLIVRLEVWEVGIQEVIAHPIVGIGYGDNTFRLRFGEFPEVSEINSLHNTLLMVAVGSGIPAGVFWVWAFVEAVRQLAQRAGKTSDADKSVIMIGIAAMIVGFVTQNLFAYMFAGSLAYLFWIVVATGFTEGMPRHSEQEAEAETLSSAARNCTYRDKRRREQ